MEVCWFVVKVPSLLVILLQMSGDGVERVTVVEQENFRCCVSVRIKSEAMGDDVLTDEQLRRI